MNGQEKDVRLTGLLHKELELLVQVREMTAAHEKLLAEDSIETLNKSLDKRGVLINEINRLHQEADALMQSYVSVPNSQTGTKPGSIEDLVGRRRGIMMEILEMDKENMKRAKTLSEQYSQEINKLDTSKKSIGAYKVGGQESLGIFDKTT